MTLRLTQDVKAMIRDLEEAQRTLWRVIN